MWGEKFCRLCLNSCVKHASLFDEYGQENEKYQIANLYFDKMVSYNY